MRTNENKEQNSQMIPFNGFIGYDTIKIPTIVESTLRNFVSTKRLKKIDTNPEVAIELCLLFLSNLSNTYLKILNIADDSKPHELQGWKALNATILRSQFSKNHIYKNIIKLLIKGTSNGPIIECDNKKMVGRKCYYYRLTNNYLGKGIIDYKIQTTEVIELQKRKNDAQLIKLKENTICRSMLNLYNHLTVPTYDQIEIRADELINDGYTNKSGKMLRNLGHKTRADFNNTVFTEDHIKIYNYLMKDGRLKLPKIGSEYSGGRCYDSITSIPKYIRNMIQIDNEEVSIVDYSALHPNIAISLFGGRNKYLTHQIFAKVLNMDLKDVKIENLSYLNRPYNQMCLSSVHQFYLDYETVMLGNLLRYRSESLLEDKEMHKATSKLLLATEVAIMSDVLLELENQNIVAGYVFDAIMCKKSEAEKVQKVMDDIILKHDVYTTAKIE